MSNVYVEAKNIALQLLRKFEIVSPDDVARAVDLTLDLIKGMHPNEEVDQDRLIKEVEDLCNVWVPDERALEGDDDHADWLEGNRAAIDWNFWDRYERYLEMDKGWAPAQVRKLGEVTDFVLSRLENPSRPGKWDRRGMVVGQVQSGKTANYTGLICKAADAGYRLIVVLAGIHNSLRSQTQERLDREFLGFDTRSRLSFDQGNARIGVGAMKGPFLHAHSLTSSDERGDFKKRVADQVWVQAGGADPVILVVKKNASVLRNLYNWATDVQKEVDPATGLHIVRGVPLLVIDDEADYASVNTKAHPTGEDGRPVDDYDPTKINGWIRRLLRTFEKSAYVAYTATPFANIFIDEDEETETFGEDLFPRSFIVSLRPPSNYTGVARVFGLDADVMAGIEAEAGIPSIRTVTDSEAWLPDKHKKFWIPDGLPFSLIEATNAFLLATAARRARGQMGHNSMLVHVTRFTAVQAHVQRNLNEHIKLLRSRIQYGDIDSPTSPWRALRELWERDFVPTTMALMSRSDLVAEIGRMVDWKEIREFLPDVLLELQLRTMNGTSEDALAYTESVKPLTVIAIGGDKLSRGLTLEGLTVSYYLRASKMYDTLMQMGRWFGYRPGYLDVCRLYTTDELASWYRDIAVANEELLREFDYMVALGKTPKDYGLRVRAHPDGLMITAAAKMRNGAYVDVTFSQTISESIYFDTGEKTLRANLLATENLVNECGEAQPRSKPKSTIIWQNVPPSAVVNFLDSYSVPDNATKARPAALAEYIRTVTAADPPELSKWTVALISVEAGKEYSIEGVNIGLVTRAVWDSGTRQALDRDSEMRLTAGQDRYVIKRLVSPEDEQLDLTADQRQRALSKTINDWHIDPNPRGKQEPERAGGLQIRRERSPQHGLLLVYPLQWRDWMTSGLPAMGFAISFPLSPTAKTVRYRVTNLWWEQEFGSDPDGTS
jgi:Z1 domain